MFKKFTSLFRIPELRNKVLFVLGMMALFRLAASIPVSGVNADKLREFFSGNQIFGILNIFTGGSLSQLSLVMLGLSPYITALIILQLLTMIFPSLKDLYYEQGEQGREKFNTYARLMTLPLALLQGYGFLKLLEIRGVLSLSGLHLIADVIIITAGAIFLMWVGELMSERGIGNGISLLIFAGIISRIPLDIFQVLRLIDWSLPFPGLFSQLSGYLLFLAIGFFIIAGVAFVSEAQRNVPVSYAKRVRGHRMYGGATTYLPIKVNQTGMIPLLFALSVLVFPQTIFNFLKTTNTSWIADVSSYLVTLFQNQLFYASLYFFLVVIFTYFYTQISFEPHTIAENLQKQGAFILGVRPGQETTNFLSSTVNKITLAGAIFLGLVAIAPITSQAITGIPVLTIGGTAILIVVSVILETVRQVEAQIAMREY